MLGAKRKTLAGFSSTTAQPHQGFIFASDIIQQTPPGLRPKAARLVGAKTTLLARIDAYGQVRALRRRAGTAVVRPAGGLGCGAPDVGAGGQAPACRAGAGCGWQHAHHAPAPTHPLTHPPTHGLQDPSGTAGREMKEEMLRKIEKWQEPPPAKTGKVLPRPDEEVKKRRGGKRYRKMKVGAGGWVGAGVPGCWGPGAGHPGRGPASLGTCS